MDNSVHQRVLSIIHIVTGVLTLIIFLLGSIFFRTFLPFIEEEIYREEGPEAMWIFEFISSSVIAIITVVLLVVPLPSIVGGIALLNKKNWGFVLLMISGCLQLFSFPVGTAIGVYTIWVYIQSNKDQQHVKN